MRKRKMDSILISYLKKCIKFLEEEDFYFKNNWVVNFTDERGTISLKFSKGIDKK